MPDPFVPNDNALSWATALESRRFKQGSTRLHVTFEDPTDEREKPDDEYCCLGVACVLYNEAHPEDPIPVTTSDAFMAVTATGDIFRHDVVYGEDRYSLPDVVVEWLELDDNEGSYGSADGSQNLVHDNDSLRHSFATIATTVRTTRSLYAA